MITAVRLRLVAAARRPVAVLLGTGGMADAVALVSDARAAVPGLLAAEVFDAAGMALVRDHLRLAHPLAGEHPVYVLLEAAGSSRRSRPPSGTWATSPSPTTRPRRAALWRYREALNPAVNAAACRTSSTCPSRSARWRPSPTRRPRPSRSWAAGPSSGVISATATCT